MKSEKPQIIFVNRLMKISKCVDDKGNKYKIEMTDGRFCRFWERYFANDEEAIESAKQEKGSLK